MNIQELYESSSRLVRDTDLHFRRYLYTDIDWDVPMLCIRGAKGVGKTTMMLQRIKESGLRASQALYVSLDDLWFSDHRLVDLAGYHFTHGGTHLFLDEVHRYPFQTWSQELKNISDRYPQLRVVFSGSSLLQINKSEADLSRRCIFWTLRGMSFREFLSLQKDIQLPVLSLSQLLSDHESLAADITSGIKVLPLFSEYLRQGYYPFYLQMRRSYAKAIQQVVANIIDTDLPAVRNVEYVTLVKLKRLFFLISQMVPFTLNLTSLGQQIEAPRQSVLKMLETLKDAALLNLLYNSRQGLTQLSKPEKVFLENPNLLYAMSANAEIGTVRETFFVNQLGMLHDISFSDRGDFKIDHKYTIEVGGRSRSATRGDACTVGLKKDFSQISNVPDSYVAADDIEIGFGNKIPLWMFGLLY